MDSAQWSPRVGNAVRDLAVFVASRSRRPWTLEWDAVAEKFAVEIGPIAAHPGVVIVGWSVPSEGVSGSFDADEESLVRELAQRVGDLASELWSDG